MKEILEISLLPYMLPVTLLLGLLLAYVVVGAISGAIADSLDVDFDVDTEGVTGGGIMATFLQLVNAHKVPTMLVLSMLTLFMWLSGVAATKLFNPTYSNLVGVGLLGGCLVVSLIATRYALMPLIPLFKLMKSGEDNGVKVEGMHGVVKSIQLTDEFGQVELIGDDGPVLLNSKLRAGDPPLNKGDDVVVLERSKDGKFCYVTALKI